MALEGPGAGGEVLLREVPGVGSCEVELPGPSCLVVFGASGDLARRKIIPALYRLEARKLLSGNFCVMGAARTEMSDGEFRSLMREAVRNAFPEEFSEGAWEEFAEKLYYTALNYADGGAYRALSKRLAPIEEKHGTGGNRLFYLAVPPPVYETAIENLGASGLSGEERGYTHLVIEKPFGRDIASAARLNGILKGAFAERQIYRMDHYLAKETVQDVLMFRFANSIFEPLWNRRYIDHIQITVAETLGVEHRAGYYERAGVIRDMFQNHIFQLLALTAMEPPSLFEADRVRDEKVKVFRSVRPFPLERLSECVALGQYGQGETGGGRVPAYREEEGVAPESATPTYCAMKVHIDNWRWNGVPFYLRSGKRLKKRRAEISVHFRQAPHLMFANIMEGAIEPNNLVLRIQPEEGINLMFQTKRPGTRVCLSPVKMDFSYAKVFALEAYERVLLDCMQGDQMLFVREDGVRLTWELLSPVLERLEAEPPPGFPNYASGSEGPAEAGEIIGRDGRKWRPL